jgi:pyruvate dehydrogenase E2 component (dihydrolipoamide acetyltransferase)
VALFEKHLKLAPPLRPSGWRNIAIGTWRSAKDPSVYGVVDLDVAKAEAYLTEESLRLARTGAKVPKLTMTHFLGKAVAEAMRRHPQINCVLRLGKLYPRRSVTLFFQVATDEGGEDLSGVTVRDAAHKSVVDMATEMAKKVGAVRDGSDKSYKEMKSLMRRVPGWLAGLVLDLAAFLQYTLNLWSPLLGTPKDPMGSVMITNVGTLGLELGFAPLVAYSRVPMVIAAGAVKDRVVPENGVPVVRPMMRLGVTFDHRIIDGVHAAKMARTVEAIFASPETELAPREKSART